MVFVVDIISEVLVWKEAVVSGSLLDMVELAVVVLVSEGVTGSVVLVVDVISEVLVWKEAIVSGSLVDMVELAVVVLVSEGVTG